MEAASSQGVGIVAVRGGGRRAGDAHQGRRNITRENRAARQGHDGRQACSWLQEVRHRHEEGHRHGRRQAGNRANADTAYRRHDNDQQDGGVAQHSGERLGSKRNSRGEEIVHSPERYIHQPNQPRGNGRRR